MDVRMPATDGAEGTRRIRAVDAAKVLVLSTFDPDQYLFAAFQVGAGSFLPRMRHGCRSSTRRALRAVGHLRHCR